MRPLLISGGRVIDPSRETDGIADVLVSDGKIEAVGHNIPLPEGGSRVDATGKVVAPGLIDVHVHLREPGQEHMGTIATGARGRGGRQLHGDLRDAQHTDPVIDNQAAVGFVVGRRSAPGWPGSTRSAASPWARRARSWPSSARWSGRGPSR
ncbi:MAG: hypothetical protein R2909_05080 [Gemmatimonadales bacterium]